jgi:VanZ family protein
MSRIWLDKWIHVGLFFVFAVFLALNFSRLDRKAWITILLTAAIYGMSVEWMQDRFIPYRSFDIGDWFSDIAGTALGLFVYSRYEKK